MSMMINETVLTTLEQYRRLYRKEPFMIKMDKDYMLDLMNEDRLGKIVMEMDGEGFRRVTFDGVLIALTDETQTFKII